MSGGSVLAGSTNSDTVLSLLLRLRRKEEKRGGQRAAGAPRAAAVDQGAHAAALTVCQGIADGADGVLESFR